MGKREGRTDWDPGFGRKGIGAPEGGRVREAGA